MNNLLSNCRTIVCNISLLITFIVLSVLCLFATFSNASTESVCYGTTKNGALENGVKLPTSGNNFTSYGLLPQIVGRTYVHEKVKSVIVNSFQALEQSHPNKRFKYAETGLKQGGKFKPHKTHQNGLSVDFMVPVINQKGESVHLPTHALNRYGYDIEFDQKGKTRDYQIDFDALSAHLKSLHQAAQQLNIKIWRVLFDPALQKHLYASKDGEYVKKHLLIPQKKSWVRHDEHYHVDFAVPCRDMKDFPG